MEEYLINNIMNYTFGKINEKLIIEFFEHL